MKLDLPYDMFETVIIKGLETKGLLTQININGNNIRYEIDYYLDGKAESIWAYDFEIEKVKQQRRE